METFSALLAICAGNPSVPGEFPTQRPVTRSFDVYFDLSPNKRLSKHSWGWWFETLSGPLWRHSNDTSTHVSITGLIKLTARQSVLYHCLGNLHWQYVVHKIHPMHHSIYCLTADNYQIKNDSTKMTVFSWLHINNCMCWHILQFSVRTMWWPKRGVRRSSWFFHDGRWKYIDIQRSTNMFIIICSFEMSYSPARRSIDLFHNIRPLVVSSPATVN